MTAVSERATVNARFVIMAVPPNLYSRVSFDPPLPRRQHQMHQHQSLGLVIKVHAVYEHPVLARGRTLRHLLRRRRLVQEVYDNTNHEDTRGTLVGFVSDEKADAMFELSAEERRRAILESIAGFLGDKALEPEVYYESDWGSEEWTRGAYAASYDLGGLHRYGKDQHAAGRPDLLVLLGPRRRGLPARRRRGPDGTPARRPGSSQRQTAPPWPPTSPSLPPNPPTVQKGSARCVT